MVAGCGGARDQTAAQHTGAGEEGGTANGPGCGVLLASLRSSSTCDFLRAGVAAVLRVRQRCSEVRTVTDTPAVISPAAAPTLTASASWARERYRHCCAMSEKAQLALVPVEKNVKDK